MYAGYYTLLIIWLIIFFKSDPLFIFLFYNLGNNFQKHYIIVYPRQINRYLIINDHTVYIIILIVHTWLHMWQIIVATI